VSYIKVYLDGSFFRRIEDSTGIKIDYIRTSKNLSIELEDFLKSHSIFYSELEIEIEIERNFNGVYILGEADLKVVSTQILNWWHSWKISSTQQLLMVRLEVTGNE